MAVCSRGAVAADMLHEGSQTEKSNRIFHDPELWLEVVDGGETRLDDAVGERQVADARRLSDAVLRARW